MSVTYLLVVVYLSYLPGSIPATSFRAFTDLGKCKDAATLIYKNVKAGQVRAFCFDKGVPDAVKQEKR